MRMNESETIELKEIYTPDLKKEVVAFANTNGGTIFIGVQDDGEIKGLDNADLKKPRGRFFRLNGVTKVNTV